MIIIIIYTIIMLYLFVVANFYIQIAYAINLYKYKISSQLIKRFNNFIIMFNNDK